jgi:GntR family transcriptional regulator, transcriptional repressor for pyruvate dehydrogenase complex
MILKLDATNHGPYTSRMSPASDVKAQRKPHFRKIGKKIGLVDRVVQTVKEQILDGRLSMGAQLPSEEEFAESLGVSRPVVREAVRTLVTMGLLETRHGVGTTVSAVTHQEIATPLKLFLRTSGREVNLEHLHQVRSILEAGIAALAARMRTEADIEDLVRLAEEMKASADDPEAFAARDSEFHRRIAKATQNPLLALLLDSIQETMSEVRELVSQQPGLFDRVTPGHICVLESIIAQNPSGARAAMHEHLETALDIQRELIQTEERRTR